GEDGVPAGGAVAGPGVVVGGAAVAAETVTAKTAMERMVCRMENLIRCSRSDASSLEPVGVLLLVIRAIRARLDGLPPAPVGRVPVDHGRQAALAEGVLRHPPESAELAVVHGVAAIVASTVLDVADQCRIGAGQLEDPVRHLDVLVILAADVVD